MAGRDDLGSIQSFIDERGVDAFPHIVDETGEVWSSYDVRSQPAFVFINDDGTVSQPSGAMSSVRLQERLDELAAL